MTKFLKALKLLYNTNLRRSSLAILRYGVLDAGYLRVTDRDHHLTVAAPDGTGMADIGILTATGDLRAAIAAGQYMSPADAPVPPPFEADAVPVPIACCTGITPVAGAVSTDLSHAVLAYVHINFKGWAEATDGHRMYRQRIPEPPVPFTIDPLTLKLTDALPAPECCMVGEEYLFFSGDGWTLTVKRNLDPYPDVEKIIPKLGRTRALPWGAPQYKAVKDALARYKIYWSNKLNLVKFSDNEIIIRNRDLNYYAATPLGFQAFDFGGTVIGVNAKYLGDLLKFLGNRPADVTAGDNMISAIIFEGDGFMVLQMPLRCLDKDVKQTREGALGADYE
jgi:hypothetical protein